MRYLAAMLLCASLSVVARGQSAMNYRVIEQAAGPPMRLGDWRTHEGKIERAGGTIHLIADPTCRVQRVTYPYGGGGDVELSLTFSFDQLTADGGELIVHFNQARVKDHTPGFRVRITRDKVTAIMRDDVVATVAAPAFARNEEHTIRLATLANDYAIWFDDAPLASGRMLEPYTDNEGELVITASHAVVRLIAFSETFIVHDIDPPTWQRGELLYEESFGEQSARDNWYCNQGEPPAGIEVHGDHFIFRHMSNSFIRQRFDGPIAFECVATPVPTDEHSAGVTDAIFIWMINHPDRDLFAFFDEQPSASLFNFMHLPFYWTDFGGSNNVTTRMRRNPHRHMIRQFTDRARLLKRDATYRITCVQYGNWTAFHVDGEPWIQAYDPNPLDGGHVGFRAYNADLRIDEIKVWRIEP
jgi:hypothetical protein